jgi:hypothetical protein
VWISTNTIAMLSFAYSRRSSTDLITTVPGLGLDTST